MKRVRTALALCALAMTIPVMGAPAARKSAHKMWGLAGGVSGIQVARRMVIRDRKTFVRVWREHTKMGGSMVPVPAIDFRRDNVVAVFGGQKPTGGYTMAIGPIERHGHSAIVHVTLLKPSPGVITAQIITFPFAMQEVPRLPAHVTFKMATRTR